MSFFDRFRQRTAPGRPVPTPQEGVAVPDGYNLVVYPEQLLPCVEHSTGGVCIVCQGTTSDEPTTELERLLCEVGDAICGNRSRVVMTTNACRTSDLFAPAPDLAVVPLAGTLLWVLNPAVLVGSSLSPALLEMLLRKLHTIGTRSIPPLAQFVCVPEFASPAGCLLAEVLSQLGLQVRERDSKMGGVLAEVHRPEGVIVSALLGRLFAPNEAVDPYVRQINEEMARAEEQGDIARLRNLAGQEREELARRLAPVQGKATSAVMRAPHLRRLLLEAGKGEVEAWQALCEELLRREIPLLTIVDPKTRATACRTWPGVGAAMPVYPDQASLLRTASELGMPTKSLAFAEMPPRDLFCWMAKQHSAAAIRVLEDETFGGNKAPLYLWLRADAVQTLAEGKVPPRPSEMRKGASQ